MQEMGIPYDYSSDSPQSIARAFPFFATEKFPKNYVGLLQKNAATIDLTSSFSAFSGMAVGFKEIGENITTYCGLLFGLVAARNIELKYLNFSALSSSFWNGLLKFIIGFSLTIFVWLGFSEINSLLLGEDTTGIVAYIFRYLRYFLVAFTAVYLTPLILVVLKIAKNNL